VQPGLGKGRDFTVIAKVRCNLGWATIEDGKQGGRERKKVKRSGGNGG